jgi:hypothetical protein
MKRSHRNGAEGRRIVAHRAVYHIARKRLKKRAIQVLADLAPDVAVWWTVRGVLLVTAGGRRIAELDAYQFRSVEDAEWQQLAIENARDAAEIRRRVERAVVGSGKAASVPVAQRPTGSRAVVTSSPRQIAAAHSAAASRAKEFARALRARGAVAKVQGTEVRVSGYGPVDVPTSSRSVKTAAKVFIRKRTEEAADKLLDRIAAELSGVTAHYQSGRLVLSDGTRVVANVTRYRALLEGGQVVLSGDLLDPSTRWKDLGDAIARLPAKPAKLRAQPGTARSTKAVRIIPSTLRLLDRRVNPPPPATAKPSPPVVRPRREPEPTPDPEPSRDFGPRPPALVPMRTVLTYMPDLPRSVSFADALLQGDRLTSSRSIAFERMVELVSLEMRLEIWPLQRSYGTLVLPFRLERSGALVEAALQLDADTEPPPLRLQPGSYEPRVADAWALAVIGAAQLLCPQPAANAGSLPGWGEQLNPTAHTQSSLSAAVAGHIRHYKTRFGSAEARRRAAEIGIQLAPHETWVRPYSRGDATVPFLSFHWRPQVTDGRRSRADRYG